MTRNTLLAALFAFAVALPACSGTSVGDGCTGSDQCEDLPGGYCAKAGVCTAPCGDEGATCLEDGLCVNVSERLICLYHCTGLGDCQGGETCTDVPGGKACIIDET